MATRRSMGRATAKKGSRGNVERDALIQRLEAIDRKMATGDIEELKKQTISLMPADLQKLMTAADLVDVVEYLVTLRKALPPSRGKPGK